MKKNLLTLALSIGVISVGFSQQRYVLYEEFSGENCGPCASVNPGLMALLNSGTNPDNILIIKYQSPIPSGGPIYAQNTTVVSNRMTYYSVPFAPYGRMDGAVSPGGSGDGAGNPVTLTQAHITTQAGVVSPFNISLSSVSINASSVSATVNVSAVTAGTYTNLKLRAALVETLDFETAPGSNGETHFTNVVRQMYPTADGQAAGNTWTAGGTGSFSISGTTPSYVDLTQEHFLVVWLQDDENKVVYQTARSFPALEIKSESIALVGSSALLCGTPNTFTPEVKFRNGGTTTVTSATIFYKERTASTWSSYSWTGSLGLNEQATVTLPSITTSAVGQVVIIDSVALPNGSADMFLKNNTSSVSQIVLQTSGGAFPITADFEGSANGFTPYATGSSGYPFYNASGTGVGYDGSNGLLYYPCYSLASGANGYSILPFANLPSGSKALDFYVAYCQYASENDKLEVVYSTDCGSSWTSVWSKQGTALSTKAAQTSQFIPNSNSQWRKESIDISAIPNGAQIAFKATSNYGNNIFVDNVNLRSGATSSIEEVLFTNSLNIYPNPATNELNISLNAKSAFKAEFTITNVSGQVVNVIAKDLVNGSNKLTIDVAALPAGVYMISIGNEQGQFASKFVKQ